MAVVGVLALQGSFNEHIAGIHSFSFRLSIFNIFSPCVCIFLAALRRLGVKGVEIRKPEQLLTINSLIIPGGESTTMAKLAEYFNLVCSI
jgi:5'-phosphate synthase pdxT subunit